MLPLFSRKGGGGVGISRCIWCLIPFSGLGYYVIVNLLPQFLKRYSVYAVNRIPVEGARGALRKKEALLPKLEWCRRLAV